MSKVVKKKPNEKCEGCGYEPQGDMYHNLYMDMYVCENCDDLLKEKQNEEQNEPEE